MSLGNAGEFLIDQSRWNDQDVIDNFPSYVLQWFYDDIIDGYRRHIGYHPVHQWFIIDEGDISHRAYIVWTTTNGFGNVAGII